MNNINIEGVWKIEGFPIREDGSKGMGVHKVTLKQDSKHKLSGESYYLVDPATGEDNPDPADSLSTIRVTIVDAPDYESKSLMKLTRVVNKDGFTALFFGVILDNDNIKGYFVNSKNSNGDFIMTRL